MSRTYPILLIALITLLSCSSNLVVSNAFHKYKHQDGVVSITVPGWIIDLGTAIADLSPEEKAMMRQIDKVKVLTIEDPGLNQQVNFYEEYYHRIRSKKGYEDLVMVREDNEDIGILGRFDGDIVRELIVLVGGDENTIVYLKGRLDPSLLKSLMNEADGHVIKNL